MIPSGVKVFLASQPIDFRKGMDGLLALVRDSGKDPFDGALYVVRARRADRIKIIWWDGSGVVLYAKRLEKASFCWPKIGPSRILLNHPQLLALVDGMDWKRVHAVEVKTPDYAGENRCGTMNQSFEQARNRSPNVLLSASWQGLFPAS